MVDERDPVNAFHRQARHRQKHRHGWILHQEDGWSLVAMVTSQERRGVDGVKVEACRRMARGMGLTRDSWFYAANMEWFRDEELTQRVRVSPCPRPVFDQLRVLWQAAVRRGKPARPPTD